MYWKRTNSWLWLPRALGGHPGLSQDLLLCRLRPLSRSPCWRGLCSATHTQPLSPLLPGGPSGKQAIQEPPKGHVLHFLLLPQQ